LRTFQPERGLIARETREENRQELARMLDQLAKERAARRPPPSPVSLVEQFERSVRKIREDVQLEKDVQTFHILRWLRS
jgi:hypothetical protein